MDHRRVGVADDEDVGPDLGEEGVEDLGPWVALRTYSMSLRGEPWTTTTIFPSASITRLAGRERRYSMVALEGRPPPNSSPASGPRSMAQRSWLPRTAAIFRPTRNFATGSG